MRYRALDEQGDYTIGNDSAHLSGADAVRQAVVTRLRQLIYEWWEELEDGVPYWQKIIATRDVETAKKIIRERIEQTTHVMALLTFDAEWDNERRTLKITAGIQSEYGIFGIEEVL